MGKGAEGDFVSLPHLLISTQTSEGEADPYVTTLQGPQRSQLLQAAVMLPQRLHCQGLWQGQTPKTTWILLLLTLVPSGLFRNPSIPP